MITCEPLEEMSKEEALKLANKYLEEGEKYKNQGEYSKSYEFACKAIAYFQNQEIGQKIIAAWNIKGYALLMLGNFQKALQIFQKSIEVGTQNQSIYHASLATAYYLMGIGKDRMGFYDDALMFHEKSLQIRQIYEKDSPHLIANNYHAIGIIHNNKGLYEKALPYFQKSVDIKLDYLSNHKNIPSVFYQGLVNSYILIGNNYLLRGNNGKSLVYYQQALTLQLKHETSDKSRLAVIFFSLGNCYVTYMPNKGLFYFEKALGICRSIFNDNHPQIGKIYENIGTCLFHQKNYEKALKSYQKGLAIISNFDMPIDFSFFQYNIGLCYIAQQKIALALHYLQKALDIQLDLLGAYHPFTSSTYQHIGFCHAHLKMYKTAHDYFEKASYALLKKTEVTPFIPSKDKLKDYIIGTDLLQLTSIQSKVYYKSYFEQSRLLKNGIDAFEYHQFQSCLIDEMRKNYDNEYSQIMLSSEVYEFYDNAIYLTLKLQKHLRQENLSPISSIDDPISQAFEYSEKSKSTLLYANIKHSKAKFTSNIPSNLLQQEQELSASLTHLDQQIRDWQAKIHAKKHSNSELLVEDDACIQEYTEQINEWQSQQFDHHQEYEQLIEQFEKDYPEYYQLKHNIQTVTVKEVQAFLQTSTSNNSTFEGKTGNKAAVISYSLGEEHLFIFCITYNDYQVIEVKKPVNLEKQIQDFLQEIEVGDVESFIEHSTQLYELLLQPIEAHFKSSDKLFIIRDDVLNLLPFDVLVHTAAVDDLDFADLNYLIKDYDISYHYSATLLLYQAQKQVDTSSSTTQGFLGIAPVEFGGEAAELTLEVAGSSRSAKRVFRSNRTSTTDTLHPLPFSKQEVEQVAALFEAKGLPATTLLKETASKENLQSQAPHYQYIHIATHGFCMEVEEKLGIDLEIDSDIDWETEDEELKELLEEIDVPKATLSGLCLAQPSKDALLYTEEAYHLQLNADLVVLSGCHTGRGKLQKGEGMYAINRGFLYAGAKNVIFTHFEIPDQESSELVQSLFKHILEGADYAHALRKAKLEMIDKENTMPLDWAGYGLIGG